MENYVISFTIKDSSKRESFDAFLNGLGFNEIPDQSDRFGNYNGTKDSLKKHLENARREYLLRKDDKIVLYYAAMNKGGKCSIFKTEI